MRFYEKYLEFDYNNTICISNKLANIHQINTVHKIINCLNKKKSNIHNFSDTTRNVPKMFYIFFHYCKILLFVVDWYCVCKKNLSHRLSFCNSGSKDQNTQEQSNEFYKSLCFWISKQFIFYILKPKFNNLHKCISTLFITFWIFFVNLTLF